MAQPIVLLSPRNLGDCVPQYCYCREKKYAPHEDPKDFAYIIQAKENAPELLWLEIDHHNLTFSSSPDTIQPNPQRRSSWREDFVGVVFFFSILSHSG